MLANIAALQKFIPKTNSKNGLQMLLGNIPCKHCLEILLANIAAMQKLLSKIAANDLQIL